MLSWASFHANRLSFLGKWAWKPDNRSCKKSHVKNEYTKMGQPVVQAAWVDLKGIMLSENPISKGYIV